MIKTTLNKIAFICLLALPFSCHALYLAVDQHKFRNPIYFGIGGGYGQTTWQGLVPDEINAATIVSTPIRADEGGAIWSAFVGYEFSPFFAVETSYTRYPNAKITFHPDSLFLSDHHIQNLNSHTETIAIMSKIMMFLPHTNVRVFSGLGPASIHRYDQVKHQWRTTLAFGFGANYDFTDQIMGEINANYTAGYGVSELRPSDDYIPFLYSVSARVAYKFNFC